jgi:hypothetical protein
MPHLNMEGAELVLDKHPVIRVLQNKVVLPSIP